MTPAHLDFTELRSLLDALCDESIAAEQLRRLEELLLAHAEAEAFYVQYMSQQADLMRHFANVSAAAERSLGQTPAAVPAPAPRAPTDKPAVALSRHWPVWQRGLALASLGALAAAVVLALTRPSPSPVEQATSPREAVDNTVAVLLQTHKAEWDKSDVPTHPGAPLPPGRLRLKSGYAHIEFYSGAVVILEGPADFQLISRTEAFCARGKLRATVPGHAQGFTIGSPKLDLVDRGTEFGLRVDGNQRTEIQVFEGKVELYAAGSDRTAPVAKPLTTGKGLRIDDVGAVDEIESNSASFLTAQELAARSQKEIQLRQQVWQAASQALRQDAQLLVYYTFQPEHSWSRTLPDQALDRQPRDGAIVGCTWTTGRWPGKSGLEFKSVSDRVRLQVPGEMESVTLMAWVRVDALPNGNNSLMMSDGWNEGALHWQIGDTGTLILGVRGPAAGKVNAHYHAPNVFTADRLKHWTHLATVYDAKLGNVTHYVNGQPAEPVEIAVKVPLRVGTAEIGNWNSSAGAKQPIRYFTGCIDEFALFSRPWSGPEIEKFFAQSRPPW
jgi:hypothetical protein